MWEFEVENYDIGERTIIFGYNFGNACQRSGLNPEDWFVLVQEYID